MTLVTIESGARAAAHDQGSGRLPVGEHHDGLPPRQGRRPDQHAHKAVPALHAQECRGPVGLLRLQRGPNTATTNAPDSVSGALACEVGGRHLLERLFCLPSGVACPGPTARCKHPAPIRRFRNDTGSRNGFLGATDVHYCDRNTYLGLRSVIGSKTHSMVNLLLVE